MNNIKNLKVRNNLIRLGLISLSLTACNKQVVDFNKNFNVVVEVNDDNISVVGIKNYSDYEGNQIQFITNDNLVVLSSSYQTELLNVSSDESLNNYVLALNANKEENIIKYDELQQTTINYGTTWNKNLIDLNYTFTKAIILSNETATIVNLDTWTDYKEDDKIQIKLTDGTCILTNIDKVKLINDEKANEDSLKNYAISLVGSEENVIFYEPINIKKIN